MFKKSGLAIVVMTGVVLCVVIALVVMATGRLTPSDTSGDTTAIDTSAAQTQRTPEVTPLIPHVAKFSDKRNRPASASRQHSPDLTQPLAQSDDTESSYLQSTHQEGFVPNADYTYSSPALAAALNGLNKLSQLQKNHANITESHVIKVWQQVDAATHEHTISPLESIKHKQWLATLVNSSTLKQTLAADTAQVQHGLERAAKQYEQARTQDPQWRAYKAAEQQLTQEILAKYPHDSAKAALELGDALDKVRTEIYK